MRIIKLKTYIFLLVLIPTVCVFPQNLIVDHDYKLNVQPYPKKVESLNKLVLLNNDFLPIYAKSNQEQKAANYLKYILTKNVSQNIHPSIINENNIPKNVWKIKLELIEFEDSYINEQYYSIKCLPQSKEINIVSPSQLGLLYGVVTFSNFITTDDTSLKLGLFNVVDWPEYSRREVSAIFKSESVDDLLNYALMNKIETIAIASRIYPWYKIENNYKVILEKIKNWKDRFGGPKIMQMHNIYDKKMIEISNPNDIDSLEKVIELGIKYGVEKLMILADDTPPFKFGQGYVLPNNMDKSKFKSMAEAQCYLMNKLEEWIKSKKYNVELYYGPAFYTYEDMNLGDINLYKDTPWEKNAFQPLINDLNYIGKNMPSDVFILWTGPNVRSRKITAQDLNDWTELLHGRVPFTWDNTIYSHFPFTSTPLFSAWDNNLPSDYYKMSAGNGMFINGNANSEDTKAAVITANDYMWNPSEYDPQKSLNIAMKNNYGKTNTELLFKLKEVELNLRKKIGERKLWFEADTLWTIIRKIRFITDKNPFYYHLNYNRLKALRMQLKNSVSEPASLEEYENECLELDKKRNEIINQLSNTDNGLAEKMKSILISLPDFNSIQ